MWIQNEVMVVFLPEHIHVMTEQYLFILNVTGCKSTLLQCYTIGLL